MAWCTPSACHQQVLQTAVGISLLHMAWFRVQGTYLLLAARYHIVLCVLGICLDLNALLTAGRRHGEGPYLGAVVVANGLLLSIEADPFPYEMAAAPTPHIEWHLKPASTSAYVI